MESGGEPVSPASGEEEWGRGNEMYKGPLDSSGTGVSEEGYQVSRNR
jgi:hypothetical protein